MKNFLIIILFIFIAASFITLPRNPLLNDDAALYALCAKNAVIHGQWLAQFVTPGDAESFLDKTPLGIWMLAAIPKITGINELTIHIPNIIYYCLILLLLYAGLIRFANKKIALYSTLIAATSLALVVYARAPKLDVPLTLFVLAAHFFLFAFLKDEKPGHLYAFTLMVVLGTLVKSGFGIIVPGLTTLGLFIFNPGARGKFIRFILSRHMIFCAFIFLVLLGGILGLQSLALKEQWIPYLKSISIQSKYNVGYLGFGLNYSIIGLLLITVFPWSPLALTALKPKIFRQITLSNFCNYWFWTNFMFFFFCYRQTDFRTFAVLVPPLAILAGAKAASLRLWITRSRVVPVIWSLFFLFVFSILLAAWLINPVNPDGINVSAAVFPIFMFVVSLVLITIYLWSPTQAKFAAAFTLVCISYGVLFYNTLPIADAFNDDVKWPGIIARYREKGYAFYIYRPRDRRLFMSPDLFYVDFMAGPADQYFWDGAELRKSLSQHKAIILSDIKSWNKLRTKGKVIASDRYSSLILR